MDHTDRKRFADSAQSPDGLGQTVLLAIDGQAFPLRRNLCYYLSKPKVRPEPVLGPTPDNPRAPDAVAAHFYGTVLHDGDRYRMWYYPCSFKCSPAEVPRDASLAWLSENIVQGPVCYAESDDGVQWRKPSLRQVRFQGSRDNNAIALSKLPIEGVTLIKDEDDPDPQRRYKMVFNCAHPGGFYTFRTATSPDGIGWSVQRGFPVAAFVEQASFYRHNGLYIVNAQGRVPVTMSEGGGECGRQGVAWVSPDFREWLPECAESFFLAEPPRPEDRGTVKPYDQVHLGVGAASLGNVAVGLYCVWHNRPSGGDWLGMGMTSGDLGLVTSHDGVSFREPVKGHIYLSRRDSPVTPPVSAGAGHETILCQANGILNVGDETRIYHGRWRNPAMARDYYGEVALATLPRDRWGALGLFPGQAEGSAWSAPLALPRSGGALFLNVDGPTGVRVEIGDERFSLLRPFSGANAGRLSGSDGGLRCRVDWRGARLSRLAGKTVRLRVRLKRGKHPEPRLYAAYVEGRGCRND